MTGHEVAVGAARHLNGKEGGRLELEVPIVVEKVTREESRSGRHFGERTFLGAPVETAGTSSVEDLQRESASPEHFGDLPARLFDVGPGSDPDESFNRISQLRKRIVIAHTPTNSTVIPRFNGRVLMTDVGLSQAYGGQLACLLIEGDELYTIHRGKKLPLPSDSGFGLLNYLREAAALDPQPSPLLKRIAELEAELSIGDFRLSIVD